MGVVDSCYNLSNFYFLLVRKSSANSIGFWGVLLIFGGFSTFEILLRFANAFLSYSLKKLRSSRSSLIAFIFTWGILIGEIEEVFLISEF